MCKRLPPAEMREGGSEGELEGLDGSVVTTWLTEKTVDNKHNSRTLNKFLLILS